ncbi:12671_t:CDS:2, partial [Cetraspora pellucida]
DAYTQISKVVDIVEKQAETIKTLVESAQEKKTLFTSQGVILSKKDNWILPFDAGVQTMKQGTASIREESPHSVKAI